jgi:hypothetical protein
MKGLEGKAMKPRCRGKDYRVIEKNDWHRCTESEVVMLIRTEKILCEEIRPERKRSRVGNEGRLKFYRPVKNWHASLSSSSSPTKSHPTILGS